MTDSPSEDGPESGKRLRRIPKPRPGQLNASGLIDTFAHRMMYSIAKDQYTATEVDIYQGLAFTVRDRLMERWFETQNAYYLSDAKRVYYLSLEFLIGRSLLNNLINLGAYKAADQAMSELGYRIGELEEQEPDAALGNGGLGRLAACFLDSAATLSLPLYGYGIRYEYGIFRQQIEDGFQVEQPDNWLRYGNPWEIPRPDALFPIKFYGRASTSIDAEGVARWDWVETEDIYAMAYDMPVVGFRNDTVNSLRLWAAKSSREFDLAHFNAGDYVRAVEQKNQTENISKVLYPPDDQYAGKELRLKQQYFFVSATLQDVIRRFKKKDAPWDRLPDSVAIQLNDTHPTVAIPELMRILIDQEKVEWEDAWSVTQKVFAYTNHTVLPEALERWSTELFGRLLPRHLQIVTEIDRRFRNEVSLRYPEEPEKVERMAILNPLSGSVNMANLAIVGSKSVNGVAELHTEIVKHEIFPDFFDMFPQRFNNKTNGIAPRRWLMLCNPALSQLICEAIGDAWTKDLDELRGLARFADDREFRRRWTAVKRENKVALAGWTQRHHNFGFDPDSVLDCQVKRIHEYKRQLLNIMRTIGAYLKIREGILPSVPRTVLFAGKAAPSYFMAKLIIKLINSVAETVNSDPASREHLKVVFVPNYGVTAAEMIFPACEISEQISTAGTEASGTGNMKAALNGALTVGTLDGANVEIRAEVGAENLFIFGHTVEEIAGLRAGGYNPSAWIERSDELTRILATISGNTFGDSSLFAPIAEMLETNDRYFHCADFALYETTQSEVERVYLDRERWTRMSIANVAHMGKFSGDRTVSQYASEIWGTTPVKVDFEKLRFGYSGSDRRS
ncbi:MAG: glycogen/starch/alpha-glucan phosphorylase [Acidobacteriota bacterium]